MLERDGALRAMQQEQGELRKGLLFLHAFLAQQAQAQAQQQQQQQAQAQQWQAQAQQWQAQTQQWQAQASAAAPAAAAGPVSRSMQTDGAEPAVQQQQQEGATMCPRSEEAPAQTGQADQDQPQTPLAGR